MVSVAEKKIGYALGGGGARGLAHIGVLKVLEERGVYPYAIAGTSIGALVGVLYAGGLKAAEIEEVALGVNWRRMALLVDPTVSPSGFVRGRRITSLLKSVLGDLSFPDLKVKFAAVATDIVRGEGVILTSGSVLDAVRASISVPGILTPVSVEGRYLVDGGLVNEVPVGVCRQLGAGYVVGVNVIPDPSGMMAMPWSQRRWMSRKKAAAGGRTGKAGKPGTGRPNVVQVLSQSLLIPGYRVAMQDLAGADVAISPAVGGIGFFDFDRAAEAIAAGEAAARQALEAQRSGAGASGADW
jgi:NTE family protein